MTMPYPIRPRSRGGLPAAMAGVLMLVGASAKLAAAVSPVATGLGFPEGTIFVGSTLYFVDYARSDVLRMVGGIVETVAHLPGCGANGLVQRADTLFVACFDSGAVVQMTLGGQTLTTIRQDTAGQSFNAPNDLAADAKGGLYLTASGANGVLGKVYYLSAEGRVRAVAEDIDFANGVALSPDGRLLYVVETRASRLLRFAIAPDGTLSGRQVFVTLNGVLPHAGGVIYSPDGLRVDAAGHLFVALYRGGGVAVLLADGALLHVLDLPEPHHTSLAITPDGRSVIVTAVRDDPDGTYHGSLYRLPNPAAE